MFWSGVFRGIKSPLGPDSNPKTVSLFSPLVLELLNKLLFPLRDSLRTNYWREVKPCAKMGKKRSANLRTVNSLLKILKIFIALKLGVNMVNCFRF